MVFDSFALGIISMLVCSAFGGSVFVPMKMADVIEGLFPQFMMGVGIFFVGAIVCFVEGFPPIYPIVLLGGASFAIGNAFSLPILNVLGMALGVLIWNTTATIMGWSVARFGLFGVKKAPPSNTFMNYGGLVFLLLGGAVYLFVKSVPYSGKNKTMVEPTSMNVATEPADSFTLHDRTKVKEETSICTQRKISVKLKIIATVAALFCGLLIGIISTPITYIQDHKEKYGNPPNRGTHYIFSHFLGFFLTSTIIFIGYALWKKNHPIIKSAAAIPSFLSGLLAGCAVTFLFTSQQYLSQAIAFPMCIMLPGCVASLWSVIYFKEIRGVRNIALLSTAYVLTFVGVILIAISK